MEFSRILNGSLNLSRRYGPSRERRVRYRYTYREIFYIFYVNVNGALHVALCGNRILSRASETNDAACYVRCACAARDRLPGNKILSFTISHHLPYASQLILIKRTFSLRRMRIAADRRLSIYLSIYLSFSATFSLHLVSGCDRAV